MTKEGAEKYIRSEICKKCSVYLGGGKCSDNCKVIEAIKALEQEPCEDEYIKVPKKALKYRTAGMVAYNAEWLKKHFDIERAVICGAQEPCSDAISRQAVLDTIGKVPDHDDGMVWEALSHAQRDVALLPPVNPQPKTGHWMMYEDSTDRFFATYECSCCKRAIIVPHDAMKAVYKDYPYCHCGRKMQESEDEA